MNGTQFDQISVVDDVISDILVRSSILKRIPKEKFSQLMIDRVKPLMSPDEVMHVDVDAELILEGNL